MQAKQGTLRSPAAETAATSMLARVARLPGVSSVTSLYGRGGQISSGGTIGFATVNLDDQATTVPNSVVTTLISTAQSADSSLLNVQLGGAAIDNITSGRRRLHQRTAGDRARACRVVLRVPALGVRGAPAADLGAGGDRSRHLDRQRPHARRLDRELGARRSPSSWRSAWAWTTRCSSSPGTATGCSPGRRPRTPPSPRSTPPAAPCCWPG